MTSLVPKRFGGRSRKDEGDAEAFVQGIISVATVIIGYHILSAMFSSIFSSKLDPFGYILGSMVGIGIGYALGMRGGKR